MSQSCGFRFDKLPSLNYQTTKNLLSIRISIIPILIILWSSFSILLLNSKNGMWWEAVPSAAIIAGCLSMIQVLIYFENKLFLGNPYKRQLTTAQDYYNYMRDYRLSGNKSAYVQIGLDCIPDVEEKEVVVEKKKECIEKEE